MNIFNKKILIVLIILLAFSFAAWFVYQYKFSDYTPKVGEKIESLSKNRDNDGVIKTTTSTLKTYRNEEWGFEFQYPEDLIVRENTFRSYYSKFNLDIVVKIGEKFDLVFLVNIVLPEFADRSFRGLEKNTSELIIAGVRGIKYEYEFEGFPETAVILPFGQYKIILGTGGGSKQYLDEFNQILASFKFLK